MNVSPSSASIKLAPLTNGRAGFLDASRGSYSERALRHARCPLLTIPESSHVGGVIN